LWIRPGWLRWRPVLLCLRPSRFTTAVPLRPHEECVMTTELIRRQEKRGTAASWTSANPTLLAGEWGIETDTGRTKLGDGATAWNDLDYRDEQLAAMAGFTGTYAAVVTLDGRGGDPTGATSSQAAIDAAMAELDARIAAIDTDFEIPTSSLYGDGSEPWQGGTLVIPPGVWDGRIDLTGYSNVEVYLSAGAVLYNSGTDGEHAIQAINGSGSTRNRNVVRGP